MGHASDSGRRTSFAGSRVAPDRSLVAGWLFLDVFWIDLYDRLWVLALVFPLALWLGALGLAIAIAGRGFREREWGAAVLLVAVLASLGALQWVGGTRIGVLARFLVLKPRYQAVVRAIEAGQVPPAEPRSIVEKGKTLRVAFPWPGGVLDNWCGVVYDPSGLVRKAALFRSDLSNFGDPASPGGEGPLRRRPAELRTARGRLVLLLFHMMPAKSGRGSCELRPVGSAGRVVVVGEVGEGLAIGLFDHLEFRGIAARIGM